MRKLLPILLLFMVLADRMCSQVSAFSATSPRDLRIERIHTSKLVSKDDFIYILSSRGQIEKVTKADGIANWAVTVSAKPDAAFTKPVFLDTGFFTYDSKSSYLYFLNYEDGKFTSQRIQKDQKDSGAFALDLVRDEDLLLIIRTRAIQALRTNDRTLIWDYTCRIDDCEEIFGHFISGKNLFVLLAGRPGPEFKLLKLDAASGRNIGEFASNVPTKNGEVGIWDMYQLGEWRGRRLIAIQAVEPPSSFTLHLFAIGLPQTKGEITIDFLRSFPLPGEWNSLISPPLIRKNTIIFNLSSPETPRTIYLVAKDIERGKEVWNARDSTRNERMLLATDQQVYSVVNTKDNYLIVSRDLTTGKKVRESSTPKKKAQYRIWEIEEFCALQSDSRFYLLADAHLQAFDISDGKQLWKLQMPPLPWANIRIKSIFQPTETGGAVGIIEVEGQSRMVKEGYHFQDYEVLSIDKVRKCMVIRKEGQGETRKFCFDR